MTEIHDMVASYRSQLRPFFDMLKYRKRGISDKEWLSLVKRTEENIINTPNQYLTTTAKHEELVVAVKKVFEEFVIEINQAK